MIELGKKIASRRKALNMTQTELGEKLNVTAQAVSKWENGLSDPDLGTLQRLSKIFGVSVDELLAEGKNDTEAKQSDEVPNEEPQSEVAATDASAVAAPAPARVIVGYCQDCKRPLDGKDKYFLHGGGRLPQYILCKDCEKKRHVMEKGSELDDALKSFRRSMIWGPIAGVAIILGFLIAAIVTNNYSLLWGLLIGVGAFALVSQLFWGDWLFDLLGFFMRAFRMPGIIFTLDLDGIIWLITVKVLLGALSILLSVIVFLFGLFLSFAVASFTFPFALVRKRAEIKRLRAEYEAVQK